MEKTVAIIQARLGSSRLPGKVLQEIAGRPMIEHVYQRTARSQKLDEVVVATTESEQDQELVDFCTGKEWPVFVGSEQDVLSRYWQCAKKYNANQIVRITSDCPLIDPEVIDQVIEVQSSSDVDYTSNFEPNRTFPRGLDVECFSIDALDLAHRLANEPAHREHVTMMIYRRPDLFSVSGIQNERDLSNWRWTVDTEEDMRLVRAIYGQFGNNRFRWQQAAAAYLANPQWQVINQHIQQKAA